MKVLLYNETTGELKITGANLSGRVFKKYIEEGFKPIGQVSGFNTDVIGFDNNWSSDREILAAYKQILKELTD